MPGPLSGVRVIDLSRYIAGPLCAQHLGDLGAEVVKVEPLTGEAGRASFPVYEGFSLYFANFNRNKLGATLNLRSERGKQLLRELVACSDVLVQNFRAGVMEEMGMAYHQLAEINPRLVMVSISGFGRDGARASWPAFDEIGQAMGGLMDLTGSPDGPPTLIGTCMVDHLAGLYATIGALTALQQRALTGEGQEVEVTLLGSAVSTLMSHLTWHLRTGEPITRNGNRQRFQAAINAYPTRDGYIYIQSARQPMFAKLAAVIGQPEILADPRFSDEEARAAHPDEVDALIAAWTRRHTTEEANRILVEAGVAAGAVRPIAEVAADPELREQGLVFDVESPAGGSVPVIGNPIRLGKVPMNLRKAPPALGEDNEYVYGTLLGHSPAELARWREEGVI